MKKFATWGAALLLLLCLFFVETTPVSYAADSPITNSAANLDLANGSITISDGGNGVTVFSQGETEIRTTAGAGIIRQTDSATATTNYISVLSGTVALTISDLNILPASASPISVAEGACLTLTLLGENVLEVQYSSYDYNKAGIYVPSGAELIIRGSGSLTATGGNRSAGIGGGGTITINGGTVTARGSGLAAGIGGGDGGNGGTITISGGTVTAIGREYGAGIGGGNNGNGGTITISGGTVTATGGINGAGIGGGDCGNGGEITIIVGTVTATGGKYGAGIGGGCYGDGGIITIYDGKVIATGSHAGIGGGFGGDGGTITINGGAVTATGSNNSAGIGGGDDGKGTDGGTITINGGTVTATGGGLAAGIGGGNNGNGGTITISGGTVTAIGGSNGAGIGGGNKGNGGTITISGGTVTATGGSNGAGIGGGDGGDGGTITIAGGNVTATGGKYGAGIGGGDGGDGGTITISDGTVTATGGERAAGIGGGYGGDGGKITINGGTVTATGGSNGTGIGGGYGGRGGTITINGGTVTATGGSNGTGIGNGYKGEGCTVKISNAEVRADGYYWSIGGGDSANKYGCKSIDIDDSATVELTSNYGTGFSTCQERITIYKQPAASVANIGNQVKFTLGAYEHSSLSYQWQVSSDNSTWADIEGQTSENASIPMSDANDGHYYRCKLTNGWGNVIYSESAQAYILTYTQQPTSVDAYINDIVSFSVVSSWKDVIYQWQRSYDDGETWVNVDGEIYATLIIDATLSNASAKYRCLITVNDGDPLASDVVEIKLDTGNDMVTYTTQYFLQKADGSGYALGSQDIIEGVTGETATAPEVTFEGFTENKSKGKLTGIIADDSSLVLKRYFDRNTYAISFDMNGGSAIPAIEALYEAPVTAPDEPSRYGYTFAGWYADKDFEEEYEFDTMPLDGTTVYAKWELIGADRGVEYHINGLYLRSSDNYELISSIPNSSFIVEVDVTNICANSYDTIILAFYKENGQFIGMQYMYAKSQAGQTMAFGSYVDNSKGDIAKIKAFVLPTLGSPIPLANSAEVK